MLIAPLQMPLRADGGSNHFLQYNVQITNLERVPLRFRLRFEATGISVGPHVKAALDAYALLSYVIGAPTPKWTMSVGSAAIIGDVLVAPGSTARPTLWGQGPIPDPDQNLQSLLGVGLQGTLSVSLPALGPSPLRLSPQLDRPARALISVFLKPAGYSGARSFLPLVGGSPEFLIPPDQPAAPSAKRPAKRRRTGR